MLLRAAAAVLAFAGVRLIGGAITILARQAKAQRALAHFRWVPLDPTVEHERHRATAAAFAPLGYAVHSHAVVDEGGGAPRAVTLLHHPDGSIVDVSTTPAAVLASLSSVLDGGIVVDTHPLANGMQGTSGRRWVQAVADPAPAALVGAHSAALAWLAERGLHPVVAPGGPVETVELAARAAAASGSTLDVLRALYAPQRYPAARGRPLWEQADVVAAVGR